MSGCGGKATTRKRIALFILTVFGVFSAARRTDVTGPFPSTRNGPDRTVTEVADARGQAYSVRKVLSLGKDRMTIVASEMGPVSMPLSEASVIEARKDDTLSIAATILGGLVAAPTLVVVLLFALHLP